MAVSRLLSGRLRGGLPAGQTFVFCSLPVRLRNAHKERGHSFLGRADDEKLPDMQASGRIRIASQVAYLQLEARRDREVCHDFEEPGQYPPTLRGLPRLGFARFLLTTGKNACNLKSRFHPAYAIRFESGQEAVQRHLQPRGSGSSRIGRLAAVRLRRNRATTVKEHPADNGKYLVENGDL